MRILVIGDIHGCYDELMELLRQINLKDEDLLISVGDIVDRGNKSKEVYAYFLNRPSSVVLVGNHERKHQNQVLSYAQEIVKVQFGEAYPDFLAWIDTLEYYYETPEAIIVHAAFEHDKALSAQKEEVLSGATSGERYLEKKYAEGTYWSEYYAGTKPIIYGHHVVGDVPKVFNNTYGIDTGCCHGQYLTAIELPGFHIHQVKAKKDYWKEEAVRWQVPVLKAKNWQAMEFADIDKQLEKLAYIEAPEVKAYLNRLRIWKQGLQNAYPLVKQAIDQLSQQLLAESPDTYSETANTYPFRTYLFKSRSGKLTLDDLEKGLNTPLKLKEVAAILNVAFQVDLE